MFAKCLMCRANKRYELGMPVTTKRLFFTGRPILIFAC